MIRGKRRKGEGEKEMMEGTDDTQLRFEKSMRLMVFFCFLRICFTATATATAMKQINAVMNYGGYTTAQDDKDTLYPPLRFAFGS